MAASRRFGDVASNVSNAQIAVIVRQRGERVTSTDRGGADIIFLDSREV
jgi:hypothetical protein